MMNRWTHALTASAALAILLSGTVVAQSPPKPVIEGDWWSITGNPDLGDYTTDRQEPVDFAVWQASDGTWQLWSCIRHTTAGKRERLFYRWEGESLTSTDWTPKGIAMEADTALGETSGGLQAPYVFQQDGTYYMFYGDWERICLATSKDGKEFTRIKNEQGQPNLFSGPYNSSRDAMVFIEDGIYYCYYTGHTEPDKTVMFNGQKVTQPYHCAIFCRTSADMKNWSEPLIVSAGGSPEDKDSWHGGDAECPFVVKRHGYYYLFRNQEYGPKNLNTQYASRDLHNFGVGNDRFMISTLAVAAPEIVTHQGQDYIVALKPSLDGMRVAKLGWATDKATDKQSNASEPKFRVHEIASPAGTNFGQTSAVDVDHDGDIDFISGTQKGTLYWFEYRSADDWQQHLIGEGAKTDVAGIAVDVDHDGWVDQISGGTWFRNPGNPRESSSWQRYETGAIAAHDHRMGDVDGDGRPELFSILDRVGVFWYRIPDDPTQRWIEHQIVGRTDPQCHGGIALGDIDGDGDLDVSRVDRWFENIGGKGLQWTEHRDFEFGKEGPWGIQTRAELMDVDRDGDLDLIQAEGDVLDGRVAIFMNEGQGKTWSMRMLKHEGHRQDFHSMSVADFDNDGDLDIFTGGGPLTVGIHQWFVLEQQHDGLWKEHMIHEGLRTHESVAADVDQDGDIDVLTKPWRGNQHVFVENQRIIR